MTSLGESFIFYMKDPESWCTDPHCCPLWPLDGGKALTCLHLGALCSQSPCFSEFHQSPWSLCVLRSIAVWCSGSDMHPGTLTSGSNGHDTVAGKFFRILQPSYSCMVSWLFFPQSWVLRGDRTLDKDPKTNPVEESSNSGNRAFSSHGKSNLFVKRKKTCLFDALKCPLGRWEDN